MADGDVITLIESPVSRKGNYFDGVDDYVLHDAHAVARVAANDTVGTYTAWIYLENITSTMTILSAGDDNSINESFKFGLLSGGVLRTKLVHGGTTQFDIKETTGSITAKTWTHVAIVQNGTRPDLFIDGKIVEMTDDTTTDLTFWYDELTLTDKFAIGVLESNNTHVKDFKGAIGQVKYFNIALDDTEIFEEFQNVTHVKRAAVIEAARVFDITMEDDGITDDGSGADNGTLTGDAHYGGEISTWSQKLENNVTGHAAEDITTFPLGSNFVSIIKRGD